MFEIHQFDDQCGCAGCLTACGVIATQWLPVDEAARAAMMSELAGTVMPGAAKTEKVN